jgi:hypothetical protein
LVGTHADGCIRWPRASTLHPPRKAQLGLNVAAARPAPRIRGHSPRVTGAFTSAPRARSANFRSRPRFSVILLGTLSAVAGRNAIESGTRSSHTLEKRNHRRLPSRVVGCCIRKAKQKATLRRSGRGSGTARSECRAQRRFSYQAVAGRGGHWSGARSDRGSARLAPLADGKLCSPSGDRCGGGRQDRSRSAGTRGGA